MTLFLTYTEDIEHIKGLADMHLNLAMESCIQTHLNTFILYHSLFCHLSFFFLLSVFSLLSDCISTFIWYSQNVLLCCATFLTLKGGYTRQFLQREESIADFPPLPSSPRGKNSAASLLVRTPLCHANCFVGLFFLFLFYLCSRSSRESPLSKRQLGRRKKVFSSHLKIKPLKKFEPMLIGEMLCPGWFMTTGSKGWVFQLRAFCGCGMGSVQLEWKIGRSSMFQSWVLYTHDWVIECCMFLIIGVCVSVLFLVVSAVQCWSPGRILGHFHSCIVLSTWGHLLSATETISKADILTKVKVFSLSLNLEG